jgi:hypothetical protein
MSQLSIRQKLAELAFDLPLQDISDYQSDQLDLMLATINAKFLEALGERQNLYQKERDAGVWDWRIQREEGANEAIDQAVARWNTQS